MGLLFTLRGAYPGPQYPSLSPPPAFNCGSCITFIFPWCQTFEGHYQSQVNSMASAWGPHLWLVSHQPGPSKASAYVAARGICLRLYLILSLLFSQPLPYPMSSILLPACFSLLPNWAREVWRPEVMETGIVRTRVGLSSQEVLALPRQTSPLSRVPAGFSKAQKLRKLLFLDTGLTRDSLSSHQILRQLY